MQRGRRAFEHRGEDVERPFGLAVGQRDDGFGDAHVGGVAVVLADVREPRARRGLAAHPRLRVQQPRPRGHRERVLAGEQRLHALRGVERGQRLLEAVPARGAGGPRAEWTISSRAGLTARVQRALRALEPLLGLVQAPEPQQVQRPRRQAR